MATDPVVQDRAAPDQASRWGRAVPTDLVVRAGPVARTVRVRAAQVDRVAQVDRADRAAQVDRVDRAARADRPPDAPPGAPPRPSAS
ncbi:MAG TPA: hypothetical protein VHO00_02350 [Actinomycetes bacterium]|nr:hypothetical protein [Actinomycetes bacterium]